MPYIAKYKSPLGEIVLAADESALTGLWFAGQKYFAAPVGAECGKKGSLIFAAAKNWLDLYFAGKEPDFTPPIRLSGTPFQLAVWKILAAIPYGQTTTYGAIAAQLAAQNGSARMAAQAVGGAVGRNPVSIIVPCHRVVGKNGSLTGYAGGIAKKIALLKLEGAYRGGFFVPKRGTAL